MTTDELRDWHAREDGWENHPDDGWCHPDHEYVLDRPHPCPPTIDGAAAAMQTGVVAEHRYCETMNRWEWSARTPDGSFVMMWRVPVRVHDTGDEIHDRYLLAKLAKEAMKPGSMKEKA